MNKINVLLFSNEDWNEKYVIPENIHIKMFEELAPSDFSYKDMVILDRDITEQELTYLKRVTRAYCIFATENAEMTDNTLMIFESKAGKRLYTGDLDVFWEEANFYYPEPYGEKLNPEFLQVNQNFKGTVEYSGNYNLRLTGKFGENFSQIVYWKNNLPLFDDQCIDFYFEYETSPSVEIKFKVIQFYNGSIDDIQQVWEFDSEQLKDIVRVENHKHTGPMFFSILAKGEGTLKIISMHDRYSRKDIGFFLPGGKRHVTSRGEEVFSYFDPGDLKPPLVFYFSGYRRQEGFEGYYMMRKMGCPFVLMTDPRLEGGAFYLGDDEYESMVVDVIKKYMNAFHASSEQVVFTGSSMGTFGAMYYGCDINPYALVLGKPLTSLGTMAKNETLIRVGTFPTSLDLVMKQYGSLDSDSIKMLDERFWTKFEKSDWSKTKFIISYLYEDDYDKDAYQNLLLHLNSEGVQVYGKGSHGRHVDNTVVVMEWFKRQINKILYEDFARGKNR